MNKPVTLISANATLGFLQALNLQPTEPMLDAGGDLQLSDIANKTLEYELGSWNINVDPITGSAYAFLSMNGPHQNRNQHQVSFIFTCLFAPLRTLLTANTACPIDTNHRSCLENEV